ncbi:uncharacterized protein GGS25DRAFT_520440 [Hypoxylon fragiforme]|uniref:uncharacterized protein n=1 Tax=Hypoxylon fragiforme TaxID=63214 RepID=UPI0020C62E4F|nr:uncharacterized protein GGS25DRAFT_520440 [Hypoxylon fragiforme]KAI2609637.1 hypothetical protein GGS25DRAFT_520440 [Hypoxylon fragiforme]
MQALTTIFNAPSWCLTRFAVAIDNNPFHSSTLSPSRGWADPSFSKCMPSQATEPAQTLSPGVCPGYMSIARTTSNVESGKTIWTGGCCQSGFSDMSTYFCTSTVTTPMAFLLLPNITTTDIYTTLSSMWIEHDQMTVVWEETDLRVLPKEVATNYAAIMGITVATTTESPTTSTTTTTQTWTAQHPSEKTSSTIAASTSTTVSSMTSSVTSSTVTLAIDPLPTISSTTTGTSHPSSTSSLSRTSNSGSERARSTIVPLVIWLAFLCVFTVLLG